MQISNLGENLAKTELVQRLQQIMQDAARAAQASQRTEGDERSRIAQEQVEDTEQTENETIREEAGREPRERRLKGRKKQDGEAETEENPGKRRSFSGEGRIIDVTI